MRCPYALGRQAVPFKSKRWGHVGGCLHPVLLLIVGWPWSRHLTLLLSSSAEFMFPKLAGLLQGLIEMMCVGSRSDLLDKWNSLCKVLADFSVLCTCVFFFFLLALLIDMCLHNLSSKLGPFWEWKGTPNRRGLWALRNRSALWKKTWTYGHTL